jgi:hypothetical protein
MREDLMRSAKGQIPSFNSKQKGMLADAMIRDEQE